MVKRLTVSYPISSKPITPGTVIPLCRLICLRDLTGDRELKTKIQSMIDKLTGEVAYGTATIELELHNFALRQILESRLGGSSGQR